MADGTGIEWTDATWNPVRGCSRVSPGCERCYAERVAARFSGPGQPFDGFARISGGRDKLDEKTGKLIVRGGTPHWTGKVGLVPEHLADPLKWKRSRRVFVNSMSDMFHEGLSNEEIAAVFGVMAAAPQHTFQVLTKRAARMRAWFRWVGELSSRAVMHETLKGVMGYDNPHRPAVNETRWPLPNVWLGASVEDQERADERIPELLPTPAAVRFLSVEPLLSPVDLRLRAPGVFRCPKCLFFTNRVIGEPCPNDRTPLVNDFGIDWVIVGGESGPGARPCDMQWIRSVVQQCKASGVPVFVKQDSGPRPGLQGRIPDDLWVKEFPDVR